MSHRDYLSIAQSAYYFSYGRARNLVEMFEVLKASACEESQITTTSSGPAKLKDLNVEDILLAVVILIHASLEEFLRAIGVQKLPLAGTEVLNEIPLSGFDTVGGPKKFGLGNLHDHIGKSVERVVNQSVLDWLDSKSFNSTTQISAFLNQLGIPVPVVEKTYPNLEALIERRHRVAHRGDISSEPGAEMIGIKPITVTEIEQWLKASSEFVDSIVTHERSAS